MQRTDAAQSTNALLARTPHYLAPHGKFLISFLARLG